MDAGLKSSLSGGIWSPTPNKSKIYLLVEPGNDVDSDEWYFRLGDSRIFCFPENHEHTWRFANCDIHGSLVSFEATISKTADFVIDLTVRDVGPGKRFRLEKLVDWREPQPGFFE